MRLKMHNFAQCTFNFNSVYHYLSVSHTHTHTRARARARARTHTQIDVQIVPLEYQQKPDPWSWEACRECCSNKQCLSALSQLIEIKCSEFTAGWIGSIL